VLSKLAYLTLCRSIQLLALLARGDTAKLWGAETGIRVVSRCFVPSLDALHALADRSPPHPPARLLGRR
jgi:uncharacterized protein (UPF0254 family)